jgi:ribosome maturation factor RimP
MMSINEELRQIVDVVLDEMGVELVELQYNRSKRSSVRVFVWQEGGISLDRCTEISRKLADELDSRDIIAGRYFLEVSSPGIDRPLRSKRDFERQIGRLLRTTVALEPSRETRIEGRLVAVEEQHVLIETKEGQTSLALDKIIAARVLVEF